MALACMAMWIAADFTPASRHHESPENEDREIESVQQTQPSPFHLNSSPENAVSENYEQLVSVLRRQGCSEALVFRIVLGELKEEYLARHREVTNRYRGESHYWKMGYEDFLPRRLKAEEEKEKQALDRELQNDVLTILGRSEVPTAEGVSYRPDERLGYIKSPEKREAIAALLATAVENGEMSANALTQAALILDAEEQREFFYRESKAGQTVQAELAGFEPTEIEFQTVAALRQKHAGTLEQGERSAFETELRVALGQERYAEYQKVQDPVFREILFWLKDSELPRAMASQVYAAQKEAEVRIRNITQGSENPDAKQMEAARRIRSEMWNAIAARAGLTNEQLSSLRLLRIASP